MGRFNIMGRLWGMLCATTVLVGLSDLIAAASTNRPPLSITGTDGNVTVTWPRAAYYYALVGKTNLSEQDSWSGVATAASDFSNTFQFEHALEAVTNFPGNSVAYNVAATNDQAFYKLAGLRYIPVCRFAVFYEGLLEFSTAAAMTLNGPVHANGNIYTGTSASLTFNRTVTTAGTISSPAWNGSGPAWNDTGTYNGNPPSITNLPALKVLSGAVFTNLHGLIDIPPVGENPNSINGASRLYNQAQVVILVSNTTVTARIQAASPFGPPGTDPAPIIIWTNLVPALLAQHFPFLSTNTTYDERESKTAKVTQIDLGLYKRWLGTNASVLTKFPYGLSVYPTLLYIADCRTNSSSTMSVVRITNGMALPYNAGMGFTLVTPNPLYVWGNYNCTNTAYLGTTNTSATVPSALICDALTILSAAWKDSTGAGSLSSRTASLTNTVNAAIIAGNVPSTGSSSSQFSGGIHNFPRLLENWSSSTLWLNTSLVCLYQSATATSQYENPGIYYTAPTRKYNFDLNFADPAKIPPGVPTVGVP